MGERQSFFGSQDARFLLVLFVVELVLGSVLLSWLLSSEEATKWDYSFVFGVLWFAAVYFTALWAVYRLGWVISKNGTARGLLWIAGFVGSVPGGLLAFGETVIVAGYPPIVLVTTPVAIVLTTGATMFVAMFLGETLYAFLSYMRKTFG